MVRPFLPDVEAQIRRGVALATIVAALNDRGIPITASNLAKLLHRTRKRGEASHTAVPPINRASIASAPPPPPPQSQPPPQPPRPVDRIPPGIDPETWGGMTERQKSNAIGDYYASQRPRLFSRQSSTP